MGILLVVLILALSIPAWLPVILRRRLSPALWRSSIAFTFSSLLHLVFAICVDKRLLTLDYSLKFAALGIPCCVMALVLARRGVIQTGEPRGVVVSSTLGLIMWLFFITVH
jgi:hypothetical protein